MPIKIPNPLNILKGIFGGIKSRIAGIKALLAKIRAIKREDLRPRILVRTLINWLKTQFADPYLKVRLVTIGGAIVITAMTIGTMAVPLSSGPVFCNKCHHTNANWDWYKKTAHQNITCYACHEPPGVHVILKAKITEGPKDIYFEGLKLYNKKLTNDISHYAANIPAIACERCHDFKNRKVTPKFGLKIDHMAHLKRGINCTRCHNRIGHKGKKGYVDWTSMTEGCFRCHTEERIDIVKRGTVKFVKVLPQGGHGGTEESAGEPGAPAEEHEPDTTEKQEATPAPEQEISTTEEPSTKTAEIHDVKATEEEVLNKESEHLAAAAAEQEQPANGEHETAAATQHDPPSTEEHSDVVIDFPTPVNVLNEKEKEAQHHILELAEKYELEGKDKEEYEEMILSAPRRCDTCHTPDFDLKPKSHKVKDWAPLARPTNVQSRKRYQHARVAKENVNYCYNCHLQKFCVDCHGTTMPHARPYKDRHGKALLASISKDSKAEPASPKFTFVNLQPATDTQVPVVKSQAETFCFRCHVEKKFCLNCHGVYFPHPADWRKKHGKTATAKLPTSAHLGKDLQGQIGRKACYTCHRPAFCDGCHGGVKMPHSDKWFTEHRTNLRTNPSRSCLNCHEKFSCERCHSVHKVHRGHTIFNYAKYGSPYGKVSVFDPTGIGK